MIGLRFKRLRYSSITSAVRCMAWTDWLVRTVCSCCINMKISLGKATKPKAESSSLSQHLNIVIEEEMWSSFVSDQVNSLKIELHRTHLCNVPLHVVKSVPFQLPLGCFVIISRRLHVPLYILEPAPCLFQWQVLKQRLVEFILGVPQQASSLQEDAPTWCFGASKVAC